MIGPSIRIKYIFLTFLRNYFEHHKKYTWNQDPSQTKILIADKYATDVGIAALRPTIILDRGSISWTFNYRNEPMPLKETNGFPRVHSDRSQNYSLTDQLQSGVTLQIMSKNSFEVDDIANEVFINISGFREWFKEKGIHKFTTLGMSKENILQLSAKGEEVSNISIQINFIKQESVQLGERLYNARVYKDGNELFENIDFVFTANGTQVLLRKEDTSATYTIDYIDAVTLQEILDKNLIIDNTNNRLYTVPDNGAVYGYYDMFTALEGYNADDDTLWFREN